MSTQAALPGVVLKKVTLRRTASALKMEGSLKRGRNPLLGVSSKVNWVAAGKSKEQTMGSWTKLVLEDDCEDGEVSGAAPPTFAK